VVTQLPDKDFYLLSLLAYTATHRKRQTYYNLPDLVLANNANNSLYVCLVIPAVDNGQWASQYAQRVAESDANPLIADIKSQATRYKPPKRVRFPINLTPL